MYINIYILIHFIFGFVYICICINYKKNIGPHLQITKVQFQSLYSIERACWSSTSEEDGASVPNTQ